MSTKISEMTPLAGDLDGSEELEISTAGSVPATRRVTAQQIVDLISTKVLVSTISGTSHNMLAADAGTYMRFTNAAAKTLTVQDDSDEALESDTEYNGRNVGAGDLTIVEDTSVTVNVPFGGTLVVPEGGTFTLKRVATDEFDLFGVTVPA